MKLKTSIVVAAGLLAALPAGAAAAVPGDTVLVSGPPGFGPLPPPGDGISANADDSLETPAVSDDGRFVAFTTTADSIGPAVDDRYLQVVVKDRQTGAVVNASSAADGTPADGDSAAPAISGDGRFVCFTTEAANLTASDPDRLADVLRKDLQTGEVLLLSQSTGGVKGLTGTAGQCTLSDDGRFAAFSTNRAFVDAGNDLDVYRRDTSGPGSTVLVSDPEGVDAEGNARSFDPSISDDGAKVAFASDATDLIAGFTDAGGAFAPDVFVRTIAGGDQKLISGTSATTGGNGESTDPVLSGSASHVAFSTNASDLVAADPDTDQDVLRRNVTTDDWSLISRATGVAGVKADSRASADSISDDGGVVGFSSDAQNLGAPAGNDYYNAYVRRTATATTLTVSAGPSPTPYAIAPGVAGAGGVVAWSDSGSYVAGVSPDAYKVYGRTLAGGTLGAIEHLSRPAGDAPFGLPLSGVETTYGVTRRVSADGRFVVFIAYSDALVADDDDAGQGVYRRDLLTGEVVLVSRADGPAGAQARFVMQPSISADGRHVAFIAGGTPMAPGDDAVEADVLVRDVAAGTTRLVSRATGADGARQDGGVLHAEISADGTKVAFVAQAASLGDAVYEQAYVRDLAAQTTTLVSRANGADGPKATQNVSGVSISADGGRIAFSTSAKDLTGDDPDTLSDVFVRSVAAGTTTLVSRASGPAGVKNDQQARNARISDDGRRVAFTSGDLELAPAAGWTDGDDQALVRDLEAQTTTLVSRAAGDGAPAEGGIDEVAIDGTGSRVAFTTDATNLAPGTGGALRWSTFVRDVGTGALLAGPAIGQPDPAGETSGSPLGAEYPSLSRDGRCLSVLGRGRGPVVGVSPDVRQAYLTVLEGGCSIGPAPPAGPGGGTPPTTPPAGTPAAVKPTLTKASLTNRRFRVGARRTALSAATKRAPVGTTFRFTLGTKATVAIELQRATKGRRVGASCRRATAKLRSRKACVRYVKVATLTRKDLAKGARRVAFSGRYGRRALKTGRHRAVLVARSAAGRSAPVRLAFTVVRR